VKFFPKPFLQEPIVIFCALVLLTTGVFILNSLSPDLFPQYYIYILVALSVFYLLYLFGFDIVKYFTTHLYVFSIVLLVLTLVIGRVTRGAVRWIPLGDYSFQASEVVRPFLLLFFAQRLSGVRKSIAKIAKLGLLAMLPVLLIAIQPSFGVALLTTIGISVIFAFKLLRGKSFIAILFIVLLGVPLVWTFFKPYQRERISNFFIYESDPSGSGYNTIQSIISTGSGGLLGRGFKKGFQTQLRYLPEKHTDFVFAGISEELGFVGASIVLAALFILYFRIISLACNSDDEAYTLFAIGSVVVLIGETVINVGMNLGLLPITGIPLPLVSAGGSSLLSSFITLSLIMSGKSVKKVLR